MFIKWCAAAAARASCSRVCEGEWGVAMRVCISPLCGCRLPFMLAQRSYNYYNLMQITHRECVLVGTRRPDESTKRKMENPLFGCCIHFYFFLFIFYSRRSSILIWHVGFCRVLCDSNQYLALLCRFLDTRSRFVLEKGRERERWNRASVWRGRQ